MNAIFQRDVEGVDWAEMKATLNADRFDNGRTVEQYRKSFENSYSTCVAYVDGKIIGTARVLSDGVGNAYMMDVWTLSKHRRQGIARRMIELLLADIPGQHVYLQTDDDTLEFYEKLGFKGQPHGLSKVVGDYLKNK